MKNIIFFATVLCFLDAMSMNFLDPYEDDIDWCNPEQVEAFNNALADHHAAMMLQREKDKEDKQVREQVQKDVEQGQLRASQLAKVQAEINRREKDNYFGDRSRIDDKK